MPSKQVEVDYYTASGTVIGEVFTIKAPPEMRPLAG
jgi:hypothetical protein